MKFARAIQGNPDEKTMLLKEARPILVQKDAVGLQVVGYASSEFHVLLLQAYDFFEELNAQQSGFAALPGKYNLAARDAGDVVVYEKLDQLIAHAAGTGSVG
jgi:hypothetical protein